MLVVNCFISVYSRPGPRSGSGGSNLSFSSNSPGLSMSALPRQESVASDESRQGGKRDQVHDRSSAAAREEEETQKEEDERAWSVVERNRLNFSFFSSEVSSTEQQKAERVIDAVKGDRLVEVGGGRGYWREVESDALRGQVKALRRQVETMASVAEAQSAATTAADQVGKCTSVEPPCTVR